MSAEPKDPLDWTVDEVVEYLCHSPATPWSLSSTAAPRPDPVTFEDALRTNVITGEVLLHDVDKDTLREDLGLRALGHRSSILMAVRHLQRKSIKYQQSRVFLQPQFEDRQGTFSQPSTPRLQAFPLLPQPSSSQAATPQNELLQNPISRSVSDTRPSAKAPPAAVRSASLGKHPRSLSPEKQRPNEGDGDMGDVFRGDSSGSPVPGNRVEESDSSPHIRQREQCVLDQYGKKRRRLDLTSVLSPVEARVPATDTTQPQGKEWYLGPDKITPAQLFYPITSEEDIEQSFVLAGHQFPNGQRCFVNKRLRYFHGQQPVEIGPGKLAVIPYKQSAVEKDGQRLFTLYSSRDGKVAVSEEEIQKWPQLKQQLPAAGSSKASLASIEASDPFSYLLQKYPPQEGDGDALPVLAQSDSDEADWDDETWKECLEDEDQPIHGKRYLTSDQIESVIAECVAEFENKWDRDHRPKEERKARNFWLQSRKEKRCNELIKSILRDIRFLEQRLRKFQKAIRESEYISRSELQLQCQSLEQTVFAIKKQKWRVSVLEQPKCPPTVTIARKPKPAPRSKQRSVDEESLHSESDDLSGEFGDFIDDSGLGTEEWPESMENHGAEPSLIDMAGFDGLETASSSDSDADIISPSGMRRRLLAKKRAKQTAFSGDLSPEPDKPANQTAFSDTSSPLRDPSVDRLSSLITSPPELVDLTMETPVQSPLKSASPGMDDLTIETPPLNPVPSASNSAATPSMSQRAPSISPQPDLGPRVVVEIPKKKPSTAPERNSLPDVNDFSGISRMSWESLEERQDRRRLLARLIGSLPDEERDRMTKLIPTLSVSKLKQFTQTALDTMLDQQNTVPGVDDSDLIMRTASLYISWVNCVHLRQKGILRQYVLEAIHDAVAGDQGFDTFAGELSSRLLGYQRWIQNKKSRPSVKSERPSLSQASLSPDSEVGPEPSANTPHKKRKKEVKESQEVKLNQEVAQQRVANQERQRKRLERKMESMGLANDDPTRQAVSFGNPVVYLHPHIGRRVKPHQLNGIQFMWRELIQDEKRQGCLLAHTMGLGKTMQVISLLNTISSAATSTEEAVRQQVPPYFHQSKTLILCPSSLIENWYEEFLMWTPQQNSLGPLRKITSLDQVEDRLREIFGWDEDGGVLIMSYDIFKAWVLNKETKFRGKPLRDNEHARVEKCLLEGPNIIVADEAHKMKNPASVLSKAMKKISSKSRIALTGSPLANNLLDYYAMVDWIAPGYLGTDVEFKANYVEPIQEGLYIDSSTSEQRRSLKKLQVLKEILNPKINRADITVLEGSLPPKVEFVITVSLTDLQKSAYNLYVEYVSRGGDEVANAKLWSWLAILSLCCNHPTCFRDKLLGKASDSPKTGLDPDEKDEMPGDESVVQAGLPETMLARQEELFATVSNIKAFDLSHRARILERIIAQSVAAGDKILVFSQSIPTLDYIEHILQGSRWNYCRLDGKTPISTRQAATKHFNRVDSNDQVYLISTRAGGLGLNIPGANRVVIFDFSFSPIWEEQAVGRAYRLGQKKPVFVYRFIAGGTFEEVMHNKAVFKTQLAYRVVDKKNPIRAAQKKLKEYLFPVKEAEQQEDLSEYIGKDPQVLDKIINSDLRGTIRKIDLTETFQKEDNDKLTEEEKRDVQMELADERLKRSDPAAYERKRQEILKREAAMASLAQAQRYSTPPQYAAGQRPVTYQYQPMHPRPVQQNAHFTGPPRYPLVKSATLPTRSSGPNHGPPPLAPDNSVSQAANAASKITSNPVPKTTASIINPNLALEHRRSEPPTSAIVTSESLPESSAKDSPPPSASGPTPDKHTQQEDTVAGTQDKSRPETRHSSEPLRNGPPKQPSEHKKAGESDSRCQQQ